MAFDINRFHSMIGQMGGPQSPAYFRARVYAPWVLGEADAEARAIEFLVSSTNLPGVGFAVAPINDLGYGTPRDVPLAPAFSPVDLQVMVDEAGVTHRFFKNWANRVVKFDYAPGMALRDDVDRQSFQSSYPVDYAGELEVTTFGHDGEVTEIVTMHRAYPRWVGEVRLEWSASDQIAYLPVQMSYWTWTSRSIEDTEDL